LFQGNPLPLDFSWKTNNSEYKVRQDKVSKNDLINARLAFYSSFSILYMNQKKMSQAKTILCATYAATNSLASWAELGNLFVR
jgi:hypothetical protein